MADAAVAKPSINSVRSVSVKGTLKDLPIIMTTGIRPSKTPLHVVAN